MIQSRKEFTDWIIRNFNGVSIENNSPLWIPEHDLQSSQCEWFVTVRPLRLYKTRTKSQYWTWCRENLRGHARCFYSDTDGERECWGFTDYDDIVLWMLKYAQ